MKKKTKKVTVPRPVEGEEKDRYERSPSKKHNDPGLKKTGKEAQRME